MVTIQAKLNRCRVDSTDTCVNGQCFATGCDGTIGSDKTLNKCGVCDDEDHMCTTLTGLLSFFTTISCTLVFNFYEIKTTFACTYLQVRIYTSKLISWT